MRAAWRMLKVICAVLAMIVPMHAQERPPVSELRDPAMLVADDVLLDAENRLIARGHVEAFYDGRRLTARL